MSTERELTPGGPPQMHPLSYSDLATHIQLNGVNIMGKNFSGMFFFKFFSRTLHTQILNSSYLWYNLVALVSCLSRCAYCSIPILVDFDPGLLQLFHTLFLRTFYGFKSTNSKTITSTSRIRNLSSLNSSI